MTMKPLNCLPALSVLIEDKRQSLKTLLTYPFYPGTS